MKEIVLGKVKAQVEEEKTPMVICTIEGNHMAAVVNGPKGLLKKSVFMLLKELFKDDKPAFATALELAAGFDSIKGEFGPDIRIEVNYKGKTFEDYEPDKDEFMQCVDELIKTIAEGAARAYKKAEAKDDQKDS